MKIFIVILSAFIFSFSAYSQNQAVVYGKVTDEKGTPLELVNVAISGLPGGAVTDSKGKYELTIPAGRNVYIAFSYMGYEKKVQQVRVEKGERKEVNMSIKQNMTELTGVAVEDKRVRTSNIIRIDPKIADMLPMSNSINALIKIQPGVSATNELSSQYRVRGGNFDENLVYVNDIEIYRPLLIRSGQQEGLSFVNPDMTSSVLFSAGGFDAKYGDKMSSVLDIRYKKPTKFGGAVSLGLLGASLEFEGATKDRKFSYMIGGRYKSTKYLLNTLQTEGDYKPSFIDVQALLTYKITKKLELSVLGNFANNKYSLVPTSRKTDFGTVQNVKRLKIYFEGQEADHYINYLGGATLAYRPDNKSVYKLIFSGLSSNENENYDLLGQYWIGQVENNPGSENYGDVVQTQGVGSYMEHARNGLDSRIFNIAHRGSIEKGQNLIQWGVKYQHEWITDAMNEWVMIDSAGYTLPRPPDSVGYVDPSVQPDYPFVMNYFSRTNADISSNRYTGFIQNIWSMPLGKPDFTFTVGLRANYWDYNNQIVVSPRARVSYKPDWEKDFLFRLSAGWYYQPPFYRELRDLSGTIHPDVKAQRSIQVVLGSDWNFKAWDRPFKFVTEVYYKKLDFLNPYIVDNVRIRYLANNDAFGYATGIDMKINGEFVKGIESWASLSVMKTMQKINYYDENGNLTETTGYTPRPTDQRVMFSMFFQDYLPRNPTYKMSLTLSFGTGLPFGPPQSPPEKHTLRMNPYRRVDIGFSKELIGGYTRFSKKNPLRAFNAMWISVEILNLLSTANTVSYIWVTDVFGYQYAVPNYLTMRQLNVKLVAKF